MWDRKKVMDVYRRYNGGTEADAAELLWRYPDGKNNIASEGCQLTCLAMVLRLLAPQGSRWTPRKLNREAKAAH
jgi:hypothetical protein